MQWWRNKSQQLGHSKASLVHWFPHGKARSGRFPRGSSRCEFLTCRVYILEYIIFYIYIILNLTICRLNERVLLLLPLPLLLHFGHIHFILKRHNPYIHTPECMYEKKNMHKVIMTILHRDKYRFDPAIWSKLDANFQKSALDASAECEINSFT